MTKRTIAITVRMSEQDFALLKEASDALWPRALLTNSSIILGLAKIQAEEILAAHGRPKHKAK